MEGLCGTMIYASWKNTDVWLTRELCLLSLAMWNSIQHSRKPTQDWASIDIGGDDRHVYLLQLYPALCGGNAMLLKPWRAMLSKLERDVAQKEHTEHFNCTFKSLQGSQHYERRKWGTLACSWIRGSKPGWQQSFAFVREQMWTSKGVQHLWGPFAPRHIWTLSRRAATFRRPLLRTRLFALVPA
jgi:hypothetical protein